MSESWGLELPSPKLMANYKEMFQIVARIEQMRRTVHYNLLAATFSLHRFPPGTYKIIEDKDRDVHTIETFRAGGIIHENI